jgi:DNA-binding response OmpR family regulator
VLEAEGFEVEIATNGKIARNVLGRGAYDLYVVDIRTPEVSGMQLYHEILDRFSNLAQRVLFTSGDTMSGNIKDFLDQTKMPYLAKPFTPDELRNLVKSVLNVN